MQAKELTEKIQTIVQPILASLGLELIEIVYAGNARRGVLRVFIDKSGGVTLDDCERAHQYMGYALDVTDPISHPYTLEVSSPGLDRPLKGERDFLRHRGEGVHLWVSLALEGKNEWKGRLIEVDAEKIVLKVSEDHTLEVPLQQVVQAKLLIET